MSVGGLCIPSPSLRRNTQSPETHRLQQALRNSAMATVVRSDSSSDSGDGTNAFAAPPANDTLAIVETVQEGGSGDDGEWPEVNLNPRLLNACDDPNSTCDSGLQELVIDTNDSGRANFALNVGALGNASGTPMDGAQNVSFGESTVDGGHTIDGDEGNKGAASDCNCQDLSDPDALAALLTQPPMTDPRFPAAMRWQRSTDC